MLSSQTDNDASQPGVIELHEEDTLVLAQGRQTIKDRDCLTCGEEQVLTVGMTIGTLILVHVDGTTAEIVVFVVGTWRHELPQ
jgi:hypothetical protein